MTRTVCLLLCSILFTTPNNMFAQDAFANAQNQFAFKLVQQLQADSSNVFISPVSINIALATLMEGATGKTREELATLLGVQDIPDISTAYRTLLPKFQEEERRRERRQFRISGLSDDQNIYLNISNSLWHNTDFSPTPSYIEKLKTYYDAEIFGYDRNDTETAQHKINTWISEKTNNRISSMPVSINEQTEMVILNTTYLMAPWEEAFDREQTEEREFTNLDESSKDIMFMYDRRTLRYYEDDDIQAVSIPYAGSTTPLSMLIILPDDTYGLPDIEKKLDTAYYNTITRSQIYADVKLYMPKYRIESELSLAAPLQALGMEQAFSSGAEFPLISPDVKFSLTNLVHKTFIEVDEEKTEAVAITDSFLGGGSGSLPSNTVDIDHPFLFFIVNERTGGILFMGKYVHAQ